MLYLLTKNLNPFSTTQHYQDYPDTLAPGYLTRLSKRFAYTEEYDKPDFKHIHFFNVKKMSSFWHTVLIEITIPVQIFIFQGSVWHYSYVCISISSEITSAVPSHAYICKRQKTMPFLLWNKNIYSSNKIWACLYRIFK